MEYIPEHLFHQEMIFGVIGLQGLKYVKGLYPAAKAGGI